MTQKNPIAPGTGGATTPAGRAPGGVAVSGAADISAFLKTAAAVGPPKVPGERGRLVFALDATASREPTWGMAQEITGALQRLDPADPVKYDFTICHLGISEGCTGTRKEFCRTCAIADICPTRQLPESK